MYLYTLKHETVPNCAARVILQWPCGEAREVDPNHIITYEEPTTDDSYTLLTYSFANRERSTDCWGSIDTADRISIIAYEHSDDVTVVNYNPVTNTAFDDWDSFLQYALNTRNHVIEALYATHTPKDNHTIN